MLGLELNELKPLYTPHLLLKEIILQEVSLTILSFKFLLKKQYANEQYLIQYDKSVNIKNDLLSLYESLEDRYINPIVAYRTGYLSGNASSNYYNTAYHLMTHKKLLSPEELFYMATIYRYGRGYTQINCQESIRFYEMAADQGHTLSMVILGNCYMGDLAPINYPMALKYYTLASNLNQPLGK